MPIAANSADDRVEQLIILTERLTGLLVKEMDLFKSRRPSELTEHAAERDKLSAVYAQEMTVIRRDQNLVAKAKAPLLTRLKEVTASFRKVLAEHDSTLNAIRSVTEDMVKAVANHASNKTQTVAGYGKNAAMRQAPAANPSSIALNQVI